MSKREGFFAFRREEMEGQETVPIIDWLSLLPEPDRPEISRFRILMEEFLTQSQDAGSELGDPNCRRALTGGLSYAEYVDANSRECLLRSDLLKSTSELSIILEVIFTQS